MEERIAQEKGVKEVIDLALQNSQVKTTNRTSDYSRFKISEDCDVVSMKLFKLYLEECARRNQTVDDVGDIMSRCQKVSKWITDENKVCKPSLAIYGSVGRGKTTMMIAIRKLLNWKGVAIENAFIPAIKLQEISNEDNSSYQYYKSFQCKYLLIDDVGQEPVTTNKFGVKKVPFIDLINARYDKILPTIITTNLSFEEIDQYYGSRISDRMCEMFNRIQYVGESYRKKTNGEL